MLVLLHTNASVLAKGLSQVRLPGVRVAACSGNAADAAIGLAPDVLLLDCPDRIDFAAISELNARCPGIPLVLWVYSITAEMAHRSRMHGVRGVLRKDLPDELLGRCLREVAAGELWFERSLLTSMLELREVRLSPRERQVLGLIAQGLSNKQLAADLGIGEGTVKVYLAKLFRKVGVHDRYELAMHGLRSMGPEGLMGSTSAGAEFARALVVPGALRRYA